MNYETIDERLDLDNDMSKIANDFPKNDDDYMIFIRGKNSTQELFMSFASNDENFGYALFRVAVQHDLVKNQILKAADIINKFEWYEQQNQKH